jgi:hypothetical protein
MPAWRQLGEERAGRGEPWRRRAEERAWRGEVAAAVRTGTAARQVVTQRRYAHASLEATRGGEGREGRAMEAACGGEGMEGRGGGGGKDGERGERPRNKTAVGLAVGALLVAFRGWFAKR